MNPSSIRDSFDRVTKKQKIWHVRTQENADKLLEAVSETITELMNTSDSATDFDSKTVIAALQASASTVIPNFTLRCFQWETIHSTVHLISIVAHPYWESTMKWTAWGFSCTLKCNILTEESLQFCFFGFRGCRPSCGRCVPKTQWQRQQRRQMLPWTDVENLLTSSSTQT